ncbi:MAG: hypothetical protein GVY35_09980 [Bacteroidetes bacterium]|nr:hypothetical protein [Bacteroidota bacterium]
MPLIIGVFFLAGCDAWTDEEAADPPLLRPSNTLSERLRASSDTGRVVGSRAKATDESSTPVALRPVADINPPRVRESEEATTPGASHLYMDEDRVYVGYTTPGVAFGGAIDVLHLDDREESVDLERSHTLVSTVMDVGAVVSGRDGYLYAAGAANPDFVQAGGGDPLASPALVVKVDRATAKTLALHDLASGAATDITTSGTTLYTVTGEEGFLYQFDRSLTEQARVPASDMRSVVAGPLVYVLLGNGAVQWANTDTRGTIAALSPLRDLGGGIGDRTIARMHYQPGLHNGLLYVALNDGGFAVLDANTGVLFEEVTDGRYTAVAARGNFVYAAQSNAGIAVFEWVPDPQVPAALGRAAKQGPDPRTHTLQRVGADPLNGFQANHLVVGGDYLYIASGQDGTRALRYWAPGPLNPAPPSDPQATVHPILECVAPLDDGRLRAFFGYENRHGKPVTIPHGGNNRLTPASYDGQQPEGFDLPRIADRRPGRTPWYPGYAFTVTFAPDEQVVWTLQGRTATASDAPEQRCGA